MDENNDFFGRVKAWCKEKHVTIETLMQDSSGGEWCKDTYFSWRRVKSLPKGENIARLAAFMGVSCDWLITGRESGELSEEERKVVGMAKQLDAGNFLRWMDFAAGLLAGQEAKQDEIAFEKRRQQAGA